MDEENINYLHMGDIRDTDYYGETWEAVYACGKCSALVAYWHQDNHTEWHRNNDTR